ncbi:helix-turn-helix domain-containing protein [Glutamicibacter ardleyensis]|nr:helix-turn-helix domain-containing protein [Glutamicibacter ardleyensis]
MKYSTLGVLLRKAREANGLDQSDVARQVGLRQQAISTWERGQSRPRANQLPQLCEILDLDLSTVRAAGDYDPILSPAGQPRLRMLPFEQLSDEAFEAFVRDMYRGLNPSWEVTRNGSTGYKQYGVDVFATKGIERVGIQCKHEKSFGPADVKKVVKEVLPIAGTTAGIIALSRPTASPDARLELHKHPGWSLWDGEDLTTRVRDLPMEMQLGLIDAYFPRLRESFLGITAPSPWMPVAEYEPPLAGRLGYDKQFGLVGRDDELERLAQLAADHQSIVLVVGRGGIGKTRLLTEFAHAESAREVRFASKGPITPEMFDLLPDGAPVVVLDDALSLGSTAVSLVAGIRTARPDATIVLSVRPRFEPELLSTLSIASTSASEIRIEVTDLLIPQAEELAREALGDTAESETVELLGHLGYDCPLLIVIGAHLIREGHLTPELLVGNADLREEILTHFADVVTRGANGDERRAVLDAIASVQPAQLDNTESLNALSALSEQPEHLVLRIVDELEDLGVIMRRAQSVRVVPDLLGEAVLERALVSRSGLDTRWSARIAQLVRGDSLAHAIRNVSLIDWYRRGNGDSHLGETLWSSLSQSILDMSNSERKNIVRSIEPVAAVYAERAMDLARKIVDNPAPDQKQTLVGIWGGDPYITAVSTNRALTGLIRNASYDPDQLERAMALLFEIGRNDNRPENQNPEHAMRILREIGEFHPKRPVSFNVLYIEIIGRWLHSRERTSDRPTVLAFLKPALSYEVTTTRFRGMSLEWTRRDINMETVEPLRLQTVALAGEQLRSEPRTALAALDVIEEAVRTSGNDATMTAEMTLIFDLIGAVLADPTVPASVRLSAFRALSWPANYGSGERREQARAARLRLVEDADYLVTRLLRSGWALDDEDEDEVDNPTTSKYHRSLDSSERKIDEVFNSWSMAKTDREVLDHFHELMRDEQSASGNFLSPDNLLSRLFDARPGVARAALSTLSLGDDAVMATQRVAMMSLFSREDQLASDAASTLMSLGAVGVQLVTAAVANPRGEVIGGDRKRIVLELAARDDETITARLLGSARWWQPEDHDLVLEIIMGAPVDRDSKLAEEVAELLTDGRIVSWSELRGIDRRMLLERFVQTPSLDGYDFARLLNTQISDDPASVLHLLQSRVDASVDRDQTYQALPHRWGKPMEFRSSGYFPNALNELVDWLLVGDSRQRSLQGVKLFQQVSGHFDVEVFSVLLGLIRTKEDHRIRLAEDLLQHASWQFVLENTAFVEEAIKIAQDLAPESKRRLIHGLHAPALYGSGSRTVGEDNPRETALRDGAIAIAKRHPDGSPVRSFYENVAQWASTRIVEERTRDYQSHLETRRW